ncbi:MAG: hypothetical protein JST86_16700 [Bacteroidetes bacterium]|nr:hypothetical protein [Bacteroidota bacterium]
MQCLSIKTIVSFFLLVPFFAAAQKSNEQIIADSSFGWMKIYHYQGQKNTRTVDDKVFSAAQLSLCDSFGNWMQASYVPKGCIGDIRKVIGPKLGLYNPWVRYAPQFYGTTSYTWSLYMKEGKPTPIQETEIPWGITANEIPGNTLTDLCTGGDYYFFMEEKNPFDAGTPQPVVDQYNIKTLPQFSKFYPLHSTASRYDRNAGFVDAVLLCSNNKLPFIQVTVGDLLNKAEKMIQQSHEDAQKDINEKNKGNQKSIDYYSGYENEKFKKALAALSRHKEKYKNSFAEPAMIARTFDYTDFSNNQDIFTRILLTEKEGNVLPSRYPVYKLAPGTMEMAKQDKPLWVRVTWNWSLADARMKHMHEAIINNFNFDYLYDFLFAPEKIKGIPYKPLHNPAAKEAEVVTQKSANARKAATDPTVFFFEDFSGNAVEQSPANWYSRINLLGNKTKVVTVAGLDGKWLEIKGHSGIIPDNLKKPLPENFEISFDVAVPKDIPWGAKAFEFYLGTDDHFVTNGKGVNIRLRAGFSGRPGEINIVPNFGNGFFEGDKMYYDVPGFSNNLSVNKVAVTLRKKGSSFEVLSNGVSLHVFSKAFPGNTVFRWLQISHASSDGDTQQYYFSNFNITRL